ncbi:hypothetical protein BV22DRAFT_1128613 [Leucogyrophana mollusca]|uniref:Uncharacterized protein n=1 Tax=Leucogyrophana mollusca TaxID=85980 RepID=A0ACB8BJ92_9AGAM|nr:hypothetical protein BV22DRAFT_1128613 [Leucogyrophana mollusca]
MLFLDKSVLSTLYFVCLFFGFVGALRVPSDDIARRQEGTSTVVASFSTPTSITTTHVIQTANGPVTETCVLSFTPDGSSIQEVQNCTMSMGSDGASGGDVVSSTVLPPSATSSGIIINIAPSPSDSVAAGSASASPSVAAAFSMPGRSLEVLPVGLGVFGGISAITVIIVALVTYERTQYRKAFRLRKQAQSDAIMAYGGMGKGYTF